MLLILKNNKNNKKKKDINNINNIKFNLYEKMTKYLNNKFNMNNSTIIEYNNLYTRKTLNWNNLKYKSLLDLYQ